MTPLAYTGLEPGQIRLLYPDIRPGREDRWFLKAVKLLDDSGTRNSLEYDALSYTWGEDQVTTFAINCNDQELRVHHNLHVAFPFLARRDSQLPIWIDAVCINQVDDDEKSEQISMMRRVYEGASTVWVWLGRGNECSGDLISKLHEVGENPMLDRTEMNRAFDLVIDKPNHASLPWLSSDEAWATYKDLLHNAWYRRLWVYQEVAFAKRIRVLMGAHEVNWNVLRYRYMDANYIVGPNGQLPPIRNYAADVFIVRKLREYATISGTLTALTLCRVLLFTIDTDCREAEDRIWAIKGFINDDIPRGASLVDMYVRLARSVLIHMEPTCLEWWKFLRSATSLNKRADLPSWCPDFHDVRGRTSLPDPIEKLEIWMGRGERMFGASRRKTKLETTQDLQSRQLVLCGQVFDRVEETYPLWERHSKGNWPILRFHSWEKSITSAVLNRATSKEKPGSLPNAQMSHQVQLSTSDYWSTLRGGYSADGGASRMSWEAFTFSKAQFENLA